VLNPVEGLHVYVEAPLTVRLVLVPVHKVVVGTIFKTGVAITFRVAVAAAVQEPLAPMTV
jgi:hypothetical protein